MAIGILSYATLAQADTETAGQLGIGLGKWDIDDGDDNAIDFRLEYRANENLLIENMHPWGGIEVTSDRTLWGGGGVLYDWEFSPQWHLVPNIGVGLYTQGNSDKDLGHVIQFRSQLEAAYEFEETRQRLGLAVGHISNASLDDTNPGTETFNLYFHAPW